MQFSGSRSPLLILVSSMYVNYVDCGTVVARTNKVNTNVVDASGMFRDVYIAISCKLCRLRTAVAVELTHEPFHQRARVLQLIEFCGKFERINRISTLFSINLIVKISKRRNFNWVFK